MELHFPLILDGATGTQLQKRGYTGADCAEKWVLEHPEALLDVQREYTAAGSRVLYAPTFGASEVKLGEYGLAERAEEFIPKLVALSRQAAEGRAWVAGDLSPLGKFLAPMGDMTFEEMTAVYTRQAKALEEAGVDLFVIETMMTLAEARAALLAVKSVSKKPVFVSFTCDESGRTVTGTDVTAALVVMQGMGADAFGLNCSAGPKEMLAQLRRLSPLAEVPLLAKPNAGMPQVVNGKTVYHCPPEEFTAYAEEMSALGVCIFGGCCGTESAHIEALAAKLRDVKPAAPAGKGERDILCATERDVFRLSPETVSAQVLTCTEDFSEDLEDAQDEGEGLLGISITGEEDLAIFRDCQWQIRRPLCIHCEDKTLLEKALRAYQGRALYEGGIPAGELAPLAEKYGVIY